MIRMLGLTLVIVGVLSTPAAGASLRVCFRAAPDTTEVRLYVEGERAVVLPAPWPLQPDGNSCTTLTPLPPAVTRGTTQLYTLRAANAAGEESSASNALTFRYPAVLDPPTFVSVEATVP